MPEPDRVPVPHKFVEVEWLDANSDTGWKKPADFPKPTPVRTRGWLVQEAIDYVVVAGSTHADGEYGELIAIPMGMVENIIDLGV